MERIIKYTGAGWIPGVPARDLTAEEFATHREQIAATAAAGGVLYEVPPDATEVDATPEARELAKAESVNLATLTGTGAGGRILKSDVDAHITAAAKAEATATVADTTPEAAATTPEATTGTAGATTPATTGGAGTAPAATGGGE